MNTTQSVDYFQLHSFLGMAAYLNRLSNNLVDWNRVGQLLFSGRYRYSLQDMQIRSAIVIATGLGTYFGPRLIGSKSWLSYLGCFLVSFGASHTVAILGLIKKRSMTQAKIQQTLESIRQVRDLGAEVETEVEVKVLIEKILSLEAKNNASSATLGMRLRYLTQLLQIVKETEPSKRRVELDALSAQCELSV
jgi:hypothetical protein